MKKNISTIMLLLSFISTDLSAQTFKERVCFESSVAKGLKSKGITPIDFSFKLHADLIPMAYIFVSAEENISLYKEDNINTYINGSSVGGGVGIKLLNKAKSNHALDIRFKSLTTVGNTDFKRTSYDASLAWYMKKNKFSPVVELGYRYLDSRTDVFDNYGNVYLSLGLRY